MNKSNKISYLTTLKYENLSDFEIPYKYKEIVRKCFDIIKSELGTLVEYEDKIFGMIATNRTLYYKHGGNIELSDSSFEKNFMYIFENKKDFYKIVSTTFLNGEIGELIVSDILSNILNLIVKKPTIEQDISGVDLISVGKNESFHQVKFIYDYEDNSYGDYSIMKIKNKFLDIKLIDNFDYLWFFVNNKNQAILLRKNDIQVNKSDNIYSIRYTKIKIYDVLEDVVNKFRNIAYNNIVVDFYEKVDLNYNNILNKFNSIK